LSSIPHTSLQIYSKFQYIKIHYAKGLAHSNFVKNNENVNVFKPKNYQAIISFNNNIKKDLLGLKEVYVFMSFGRPHVASPPRQCKFVFQISLSYNFLFSELIVGVSIFHSYFHSLFSHSMGTPWVSKVFTAQRK
jgi:hypothetical protein